MQHRWPGAAERWHQLATQCPLDTGTGELLGACKLSTAWEHNLVKVLSSASSRSSLPGAETNGGICHTEFCCCPEHGHNGSIALVQVTSNPGNDQPGAWFWQSVRQQIIIMGDRER